MDEWMSGSSGTSGSGRSRPTRPLAHPARLLLVLALACCTDPRARPVPPLVRMSISPTFSLNSPGSVLASLYVYDEDGLAELLISVRSSDSALAGDSIIGLPGDPELTRIVGWTVPPGLAVGTTVSVAVKAVDLTGFATSDTIFVPVKTTSVRTP
jgi:hypothetical protein